jgi:phosphatidylethanolamine/phosphatidyl-N-methylethanolamine N-methyltransferase
MRRKPRLQTTMANRALFLQEFLKNPRQVASIIPSSRFLERRIVELAEIRTARTVVELGAGVGGTATAILAAMLPDAKLLSIEINPHFCSLLNHISDERLIVHCGSAQEIRAALSRYGLSAPDVVISGIPFSTIKLRTGLLILEEIASTLISGGRFVAYQISNQVDELSRPLLGPARVELEFLNIPPLRLYRWDKRDGNGSVSPGAA